MTEFEDVKNRRVRVRNPQDFWGGIALLTLAGLTFYLTYDLPGMRGFNFGPGTAPRLFASLLTLLALVIILIGVVSEGENFPRYAVRGPVFLTAAILSFAALIEPLGLVIATFISFLIAALSSTETRWRETTIAGVVITAFCVILFVHLLKLPFLLWPRMAALPIGWPF